MNSQSQLGTLCSLAQKAVEQATGQLGDVRQSFQQAEQQLNLLINYQDEYQQRLNDTMNEGIGIASWQNYQQFILTLEKAIEQHRQQLAQWGSRLELALQQWQEEQQRLNAYTTLQERALTRQQLQENRLDQKQMDEFAQRAALRKEL